MSQLATFQPLPWISRLQESQLVEYSKEYNGEQGYFLKIYFISDKQNRNFWKVVESSIVSGLKTGLEKRFFGKTAPIIVRQDWDQAPKLGHPSPYVEDMISEQEPDRKGDFVAVGTTNNGKTGWVIVKITDKQTEIDHRDGKLIFVSPSIESIRENAQGEDLVWRINHLAFVSDPAYGFEAQVTGSCTGPQGKCILHLSKQASFTKLKKLSEIPLKKLSEIPLKQTTLQMVLSDVDTVCKYLEITPPTISLENNNTESMCYRDKGLVTLGIKNGYNPVLLIHELLHLKGYEHHDIIQRGGLGKFYSGLSDPASNKLREILGIRETSNIPLKNSKIPYPFTTGQIEYLKQRGKNPQDYMVTQKQITTLKEFPLCDIKEVELLLNTPDTKIANIIEKLHKYGLTEYLRLITPLKRLRDIPLKK